jgi:hypothetical protein
MVSRKHEGLCKKCGYDLRASKDRCPECGTPVPPNRNRRIIGRAITVAAAFSFMLLLTTLTLWIRSNDECDSLCRIDTRHPEKPSRLEFFSFDGFLGVCRFTDESHLGPVVDEAAAIAKSGVSWRFVRAEYKRYFQDIANVQEGYNGHYLAGFGRDSNDDREYGIAFVPDWVVALLTAVIPLGWALARFRRFRQNRRNATLRLGDRRSETGSSMITVALSKAALGISLLLALGTLALWAWSYRVADTLKRKEGHYILISNAITDRNDPEYRLMHVRLLVLTLMSNKGRITLTGEQSIPGMYLGPDNLRDWQPDYPNGIHHQWTEDPAWDENDGEFGMTDRQVLFNHFGFRLGTYAIPGISSNFLNFTGWDAAVPIWFLLFLAMLFPSTQVIRRLKKSRASHRLAEGFCAKCGYDLRASKERCPECGKPIPGKTEAMT